MDMIFSGILWVEFPGMIVWPVSVTFSLSLAACAAYAIYGM